MHVRSLLWLLAASALLGGCSKGQPRPDDHAPAASAHADEREPFGRLSVDEVEARIADAQAGKLALAIIDNNSESRFKQSHLPGARWLKHTAIKAEDLPSNKDTLLVFYCSSEL